MTYWSYFPVLGMAIVLFASCCLDAISWWLFSWWLLCADYAQHPQRGPNSVETNTPLKAPPPGEWACYNRGTKRIARDHPLNGSQ
jgi:hypothetical protein